MQLQQVHAKSMKLQKPLKSMKNELFRSGTSTASQIEEQSASTPKA